MLVSDVAPGETDATNNARNATVDVTEHELARSRSSSTSLGGYGAQFNQHVFAPITAAPPASLPDLEAKVKALEPQLVRIFYHDERRDAHSPTAWRRSSRRSSSRKTPARRSTSPTSQPTGRSSNPVSSWAQFAAVLDDLVRNARASRTSAGSRSQNEPNSTALTLEQYQALYRALHARLVARGLRDQIGLMGGDLSRRRQQRVWFQYMATAHERHPRCLLGAHLLELLGHPAMEFRLKDVRQIVTEELPAEARKPMFITEFGVRGIRNFPGKPGSSPATGRTARRSARTNIAAFQQLWFDVLSAQLGFDGTVKWDAYWGKYDAELHRPHCLIGPRRGGLAARSRPTTRSACSCRRPSAAGRCSASTRGPTTTGVTRARTTSPRRSSLRTRAQRRADAHRARHARTRPERGVGGDAGVQHRRAAAVHDVQSRVWNATANGENAIAARSRRTAPGSRASRCRCTRRSR